MGDLIYNHILTKRGRVDLSWLHVPEEAQKELIREISRAVSTRFTSATIKLPTGEFIRLSVTSQQCTRHEKYLIEPYALADRRILEKHYG